MSKHTPEPWSYGFPKVNGVDVREAKCMVSAGGWHVASVSHGGIYPDEPFGSQTREANARRIVACVNACRGLPTDDLEKMQLGGVLNATAELLAQREQLQSKYKAAMDALQVARDGTEWCSSEELDRIDALLAGQVPEPVMTAGVDVADGLFEIQVAAWANTGEDPGVPEGWQPVPVEPTFAMLAADGCKEHHEGQECNFHKNRRRIWKAMLAAAPEPAGKGGGVKVDIHNPAIRYRVIYADPAWQFSNRNTGGSMNSSA